MRELSDTNAESIVSMGGGSPPTTQSADKNNSQTTPTTEEEQKPSWWEGFAKAVEDPKVSTYNYIKDSLKKSLA